MSNKKASVKWFFACFVLSPFLILVFFQNCTQKYPSDFVHITPAEPVKK